MTNATDLLFFRAMLNVTFHFWFGFKDHCFILSRSACCSAQVNCYDHVFKKLKNVFYEKLFCEGILWNKYVLLYNQETSLDTQWTVGHLAFYYFIRLGKLSEGPFKTVYMNHFL